jgi:hypothetical protein
MKVHFIPFFKRKNFKDGVKEPEEVVHFNKIGDYDNYLNCYRESMKWHHTQEQAEFHIASDMITEVEPQNAVPFDMIRVKGLKRKNIIESKTLAETYIFNEADIDGPIVSSGCDHVVNGNFNKWIDENDFDIAIPLRRKAKVNNALVILKNRNKNTIDFFNHRLEMFYKLPENAREWYGDQKSYESIFFDNGVLTKGVKGSGILGLHNIMGCKVLTIPYGGDVLGTNVDGQYFFPEALFYDYKGDRKHQYQRGYIMAKRRTGK